MNGTDMWMKNSVCLAASHLDRQRQIRAGYDTDNACWPGASRLPLFTIIDWNLNMSWKAPCAVFLCRNVRTASNAPQSHGAYLVGPQYLHRVCIYAYGIFLIPAGTAHQMLHVHTIVQYGIITFMAACHDCRAMFVQRLLNFVCRHKTHAWFL